MTRQRQQRQTTGASGARQRILAGSEQKGKAMSGSGASASTPVEPTSYQTRVHDWMLACFNEEIAADGTERNHRFLEEALELVQSTGCTASEAHQLVDYVFGRPVGEPFQEAGGVMVCLAALCTANGLDVQACGELELVRIWGKRDQIRAKQAAKPKHSPLPGPSEATTGNATGAKRDSAEPPQ